MAIDSINNSLNNIQQYVEEKTGSKYCGQAAKYGTIAVASIAILAVLRQACNTLSTNLKFTATRSSVVKQLAETSIPSLTASKTFSLETPKALDEVIESVESVFSQITAQFQSGKTSDQKYNLGNSQAVRVIVSEPIDPKNDQKHLKYFRDLGVSTSSDLYKKAESYANKERECSLIFQNIEESLEERIESLAKSFFGFVDQFYSTTGGICEYINMPFQKYKDAIKLENLEDFRDFKLEAPTKKDVLNFLQEAFKSK
jgi:hypothetical protein